MKKILFTEANVRAVIAGDKTQTRRIIKLPKQAFGMQLHRMRYTGEITGVYWYDEHENTESPDGKERKILPRYKLGEKVYIAEPYFNSWGNKILYKDEIPIYNQSQVKWKNKLFMPEKFARYFIEITDVRVEQLQDISVEDCINESIFKHTSHRKVYWKYPGCVDMYYYSPQDAYAAEIDSINGDGTWDSNPYVWVYDFKY